MTDSHIENNTHNDIEQHLDLRIIYDELVSSFDAHLESYDMLKQIPKFIVLVSVLMLVALDLNLFTLLMFAGLCALCMVLIAPNDIHLPFEPTVENLHNLFGKESYEDIMATRIHAYADATAKNGEIIKTLSRGVNLSIVLFLVFMVTIVLSSI